MEEDYKKEQKINYYRRQQEKCERIAEYSLDEDNKRMYQARAEAWEDKIKESADDNLEPWTPRKTGTMKRDPANFRKTTVIEVEDIRDEILEFKKATTIEQAIKMGKELTGNNEFVVEGIHLNTINGFNEAMFNVKQRFGRNLNISGIKPVNKSFARYHQASYDSKTKRISLKGGKNANALATYKSNAEKYFADGWNASNHEYGTFYHEIGHAVWEDLPNEAKSKIRNLYKDTKHSSYEKWMARGGSSSGYSQAEIFGKELSRYAMENEQEFFSEAFSQIMSGRMRPVSRETNAILNQYYKVIDNVEDTLENTSKSGTIEMYRKGSTHRKTSEQGKKIIDKATYNKITKPAIKNGAEIRIAEGEYLEHIRKHGTAVTIGDVIYFTPEATISDVLEEVHHFNQNRLGLNAQYSSKQREIMNEIDAKEYLLSVTEKYKIPIEEVEETKEHLKSYTRQMEEMKKRGEWDE